MKFPEVNTVEDIESLTHEDMARLWRFASSGHPCFMTGHEMQRAFERRWKNFGGWNPALSRRIGLEGEAA